MGCHGPEAPLDTRRLGGEDEDSGGGGGRLGLCQRWILYRGDPILGASCWVEKNKKKTSFIRSQFFWISFWISGERLFLDE